MLREEKKPFRYSIMTAVALAAMVVPLSLFEPVEGQTTQGWGVCGDDELQLVFKNPDLQVDPDDGLIHASGYFFIQFQAIGDRALDIEKFAFSFGKAIPRELQSCDMPVNQWFSGGNSITGAYLYRYRIDDNPKDGFFIPINTTNVPDGEYAAAVSAFDAASTELVRYYADAIVENGCVSRCRYPEDAEMIKKNDKIQPWPIVLPGDGEQVNSEGGLTIEFAEELLEPPQVWITPGHSSDGFLPAEQRIPADKLQELPGREWDDDTVPDNPIDPSLMQSRAWGFKYHWPGTIRNEDIIRVRATDVNGNVAEKIMHIGDPTIGGRITLHFPDVQIRGNGVQKEANKEGKAAFAMDFTNTGEGILHGNLLFTSAHPEGMKARFDSSHITIGPGKTHYANLTVTALESLTPGSYDLDAMVRYQRGGVDVSKPFKVTFLLNERTNATEADSEKTIKGSRPDEDLKAEQVEEAQAPATPQAEPEKKSFIPAPGFGALTLALFAASAFVALRARRRG